MTHLPPEFHGWKKESFFSPYSWPHRWMCVGHNWWFFSLLRSSTKAAEIEKEREKNVVMGRRRRRWLGGGGSGIFVQWSLCRVPFATKAPRPSKKPGNKCSTSDSIWFSATRKISSKKDGSKLNHTHLQQQKEKLISKYNRANRRDKFSINNIWKDYWYVDWTSHFWLSFKKKRLILAVNLKMICPDTTNLPEIQPDVLMTWFFSPIAAMLLSAGW